MIRNAVHAAVAALFFAGSAWAAVPPNAESHRLNAQSALEAGDERAADFWLSRYLGAIASDPQKAEAVAPLVERRALEPAAFLAGDYDVEFLDWFERSSWKRWDTLPERARERHGSIEIAAVSDEKRFFTLVAFPELQSWFTWSADPSYKSRRLLLTLGSANAKSKPLLFAGKYVDKKAVPLPPVPLEVKNHALHHVWPPEFHDLDGDGDAELWLRYNLAWGNGFSQFLDVYRIDETKGLVLFKRFHGDSEGYARRVGGSRVEVARGFGSTSALAHLEYDRHRIETWEFADGRFEKRSEKIVEHLLKGKAWKDSLLS